jgi:hypothetical protein
MARSPTELEAFAHSASRAQTSGSSIKYPTLVERESGQRSGNCLAVGYGVKRHSVVADACHGRNAGEPASSRFGRMSIILPGPTAGRRNHRPQRRTGEYPAQAIDAFAEKIRRWRWVNIGAARAAFTAARRTRADAVRWHAQPAPARPHLTPPQPTRRCDSSLPTRHMPR